MQALSGAAVDFDATWAILEKAFRQIHTKNASDLSFEQLYRNAYKIVLGKKGDELYRRVAAFEAQWLAENVRTRIFRLLTTPLLLLTEETADRGLATVAERLVAGQAFLRGLKESWEDERVCMGMLTDVLMYMVSPCPLAIGEHAQAHSAQDRAYCTDHRQPSISAKAMGLFRDQILCTPVRINAPSLLEVLTAVILDQIQMDREGEAIDQYLLKCNVYMLEGLYHSDYEEDDEKLYLTFFEPRFLAASAEFYREEAARLLRESDAGSYCRATKRRVEEETNRCRSTLSNMTTIKIQRVVEDEMIRHQMKRLIEMDSGVQHMVENEKLHELGLVFELEARVDPNKTELTNALQRAIRDMGTQINNAAATSSQVLSMATTAGAEEGDEKTKSGATRQTNQQTTAALKWVADVLTLQERFDRFSMSAFESDQTVSTALTKSISDVINTCSRASEYISLFIDENMKKGIKDKTEAEIDDVLEQAITTVRFLQDKDLFETYYKKHLCKRLLLKKSQSIDVEKQLISRMKIELGNHFTLKLEAMFKDMALSEELTSGYRERILRLGPADSRRVDLSINVLTSMTWPLEAFRSASADEERGRSQITFPGQIENAKAGFEHYYAEKFSGRKLTWQSNMGDADIKATFPRPDRGRPITHEINCSTYAMVILLLFNEVPVDCSLTLAEIQAQTNIPEGDLKRNLQSLAVAPKTRFLIKEPMSREINTGDRFFYNQNFKSNIIKIKVGVVSAGNKVEGDRERKETERKSNDARAFSIEAALVRIMKYATPLYTSSHGFESFFFG